MSSFFGKVIKYNTIYYVHSTVLITKANDKNIHENTKGVITVRKSKIVRQHNGQKKKDKRTNNDLQHTAQIEQHKPPWKPGVNSDAPEGIAVPDPPSPYCKHVCNQF
jgi:hypothetical protein